MMHKVLYLSPYFWPEEIGSAGYSTQLALHLAEVGYDVHVEAFRPHYPDPALFEAWSDGSRDIETYHGLPIHRAAARPRGNGGFKSRILNDLGYLGHALCALIRGRFRNTDVTIAYVPSIFTLYAALAVRFLTGARIVAVIHDIESGLASALGIAKGGILLRLMRLAERFGLNRADHVVVLTDGMRSELRNIGCCRPISIVPIWSEVATWQPPQTARRVILMYSGNFGKKQNIDQILPLLARLAEERVPVDVVLRGDGSERARIEAEVVRRGIAHVRFLSFAPTESFTAALQEAHIHLVPQARNVANYALPSKLISIMGAGRPFVCIAASDSPLGILSRQSGAGICISPDDEDELFRAVADLAADHARQHAMGHAGQAYVRAHMDRRHVLNQYAQIIGAMISRTPVRTCTALKEEP